MRYAVVPRHRRRTPLALILHRIRANGFLGRAEFNRMDYCVGYRWLVRQIFAKMKTKDNGVLIII